MKLFRTNDFICVTIFAIYFHWIWAREVLGYITLDQAQHAMQHEWKYLGYVMCASFVTGNVYAFLKWMNADIPSIFYRIGAVGTLVFMFIYSMILFAPKSISFINEENAFEVCSFAVIVGLLSIFSLILSEIFKKGRKPITAP
jgi:hypothetical protein